MANTRRPFLNEMAPYAPTCSPVPIRNAELIVSGLCGEGAVEAAPVVPGSLFLNP